MGSLRDILDKPLLKRVNRRALAVTCREMSVLLDVGFPLLKALRLLSQRTNNVVMGQVLGEVADSIERGNTFASALANHPHIFSPLFINVVRVGEVSGSLEEAMRRLADFLERDIGIRRRVGFAMMYPAVVLSVCLIVIVAIMLFVIPRFEQVYADQGIQLPQLTKAVIGISGLCTRSWPWLLLLAAFLAVVFAFYRRLRTGKRRLDQIKLLMPGFGRFYTKVLVVRACRTFATLVRSGVPLVSSLKIVGQTSDNRVVEEAFEATSEAVERGESMTQSLADRRIFPPLVLDMMSVGESAGSLDVVLEKVAENYEEEVRLWTEGLTALLEPVLILLLGGVCMVLALAILYPYWNLAASDAFY